jgi:hypothetical protein
MPATWISIAIDDLTILLSSGFDPVSTNRAQTVLDAPVVTRVEYAQAGEIKLACRVIRTAERSSVA